jgi:quinol monooxygenase YgiN
MNQDHLQCIVEFSINRGKRAEFEKLVKEISDAVRRSEPGTRRYEWFLNEKRSRCIVIETYDSSVSGIAHARGEAVKRVFPQILKIARITRFEICGNPSEELINELADVDASIYRFIDGFSR